MSVLKYNLVFIVLLLVFGITGLSANTTKAKHEKKQPKSVLSTDDFNAFNTSPKDSVASKAIDSLSGIAQKLRGNDSVSPQYKAAFNTYQISALNHRHRVFEWQLQSSKYIFIMVNIVVLFGLGLSFWQFYIPIYKMRKLLKAGKDPSKVLAAEDSHDKTSLKMGKGGVEITSSVIGLIILVISIAFFFLYLQYVYPISQLNS